MGKINDLSQGNLGDLARQQHRDRYATPLNGSSVGHGGQRFYGTGKLTVENEGLYVTGTASISGALTVAGTSRFSGQAFIYGPLEVTGDTILDGKTDIGGPTTISGTLGVTGKTTLGGNTTVSGTLDVTGAMATKGTLSVEGVTTLKNNLNVTSGGKITVGGMSLEPASGGQINFTNGAISRGALGILINDASRTEMAAPSVRLTSGGGTLAAYSGGIQLGGIPSSPSATANIYMDANGRLWKTA